jgi:hypothetical protein
MTRASFLAGDQVAEEIFDLQNQATSLESQVSDLDLRKERYQIAVDAQGLKGEAFPRSNLGNSSLTTQRMNGTLLGFREGDVVTNVCCALQANGATLTLAKIGLYSTAGVLLASTAESSSSFTSGAPKTISLPLTSPYTILTQGGYYIAILVVGTTMPNVYRGGVVAGTGLAFSGGVRFNNSQAGLTDLPANATFADADNLVVWFGWS